MWTYVSSPSRSKKCISIPKMLDPQGIKACGWRLRRQPSASRCHFASPAMPLVFHASSYNHHDLHRKLFHLLPTSWLVLPSHLCGGRLFWQPFAFHRRSTSLATITTCATCITIFPFFFLHCYLFWQASYITSHLKPLLVTNRIRQALLPSLQLDLTQKAAVLPATPAHHS